MNTPLREYDEVRVVKLNAVTRDFDGTDAVKRAPQVGDVAVICHQYEPKDPHAAVAVEMVDKDGMTVWLADFLPDELELIRRPTR